MGKHTARFKAEGSGKKKLDLLLVNPSLDWKMDQERKKAIRIEENIPNQETPHIGMAYLLSVAKQEGIHAQYIDMVMEGVSVEQLIDYVRDVEPSLVGLTAFTIQANTAGAIANRVKESFPSTKICIGGPHAIAAPQETLDAFAAVDFVVCGEGELILTKIMEALNSEEKLSRIDNVLTRGKNTASISTIRNLDAMPFPAWDMFDLSKYPGTYPHRTRLELPMITERGCPYKCTFCCRSHGDTLRRRSSQSIIAEIQHNTQKFQCESIAFLDETFIANTRAAKDFLNTLIDFGLNKKITWSCSTRVSNMTLELLQLMRKAGCYYIFYGMESADNDTLKRIGKGITVEQIRNAVKWTKQAGIVTVGAFILGLEGDTEQHILKAITLAEELDLYSVTFPIAVPFPGTSLRELALKKEYGMRVISDNWDHYGKQGYGALESDALPFDRRKELQCLAYERNPKKKLDEYMDRMRRSGYPY